MATITLWKGVRRVVCGDEYAFVETVEVTGEEIGACWEEENCRGTHTVFYKTPDGRIVVHVIRWSRWENEATYGYIHVFPSLEGVNGATAVFWREMVQAGLIPPRSVGLDEVQ